MTRVLSYFENISSARHFALAMFVGAAAGALFYLASAPQSRSAQDIQPVDLKPAQIKANGCTAKVAGKTVQLEPGDGVDLGDVWLICQTYDGHLLLVRSATPPTSTAIDGRN